MNKPQVIYYSDELNDEFSGANITPRIIDENYKYTHKNMFWNASSFILQNVLSMPIKKLVASVKFHIEFVGREKFKKYSNTGYFIYVNHTQQFGDTFIPSLANYPKRNYFIVNPENVSMKGMQTLVEMLGAIPIASNVKGMKNFMQAIDKIISDNHSVTIYPEAHIWPYYTKIRPFKDVSFKYPVKLNVPTFCITNTYQKYGKYNDKIRIVSYVDGPFFPSPNLKPKEQQVELRNLVYDTMVKRSENNNVEYIKYIKKPKESS